MRSPCRVMLSIAVFAWWVVTSVPGQEDGAAAPHDEVFSAWQSELDDWLPKRVRATFRRVPWSSSRRQALTGRDGLTSAQRRHLEAAAELGVLWLLAHQDAFGGWASNEFDTRCGRIGDGICPDRGGVQYDIGVTALALQCLLRSEGLPVPLEPAIEAGLDWLTSTQEADGRMVLGPISTASYDHALASWALVEALHRGHERYRPAAQRALDFLVSIRSTGGGWRYLDADSPDMIAHPADSSMTSWALVVLARGRDARLDVDAAALEQGIAFLDTMTGPDGRTGYYDPGGMSARPLGLDDAFPADETEAMTAAAMVARVAVGRPPRPLREEVLAQGLEILMAMAPGWRRHESQGQTRLADLYYWSYGTRAVVAMGDKTSARAWGGALYAAVVEQEHPEGDARGSWDARGTAWGGEGGRVYSTAIMTLALQEAAGL